MDPQDRLNRITIMTGRYLEPTPYRDRNGEIAFSTPSRDRAFIQDIIAAMEGDQSPVEK